MTQQPFNNQEPENRMLPIVNSHGIMECSNKELAVIARIFSQKFDNFQQAAADYGRHDVANELSSQINELEAIAKSIDAGKVLNAQERNDMRMTIKFTEKYLFSELFLE